MSLYKSYCFVRKDLKMGVGKIAGQCGHAYCDMACKESSFFKNTLNIFKKNDGSFQLWKSCGQTKIILKVNNEDEMYNIYNKLISANIRCYPIYDLGKTQIDKNSWTVFATQPISENNDIVKYIVENYKLL